MKEEIVQNSFEEKSESIGDDSTFFSEEEKRNLSDCSLEEYEDFLRYSKHLGEEGGRIFNDLAKKSLYKPEIEENYKSNEKNAKSIEFELNYLNRLKVLKKEWLEKGDFSDYEADRRLMDEFLVKYSPSDDQFYSSAEGDNVLQKKERIYAQENGDNIINEKIYNYIKSNSDASVVRSDLLIRNRESGLSLDFSQLIPEHYNFVPGALVEKARMKKVDLEVYENNENDDYFSANYFTKQIAYGDLRGKGKILSLFHEIAHSWQSVYHRESAKYNYQEFINSVLDRLSRLKYAVSAEEQTENQKENAKVMHGLLKKAGVELDLENFYKKIEPEKGEYKLFNQADNSFYIIKSKKLEELIAKYQFEERNAWAHAIKMLRFFRKEGFDLEPGLQKIGEIEEYIRNYLDTYQKNMEEVIQGNDKKVKFI